jgi:hypothetical protein
MRKTERVIRIRTLDHGEKHIPTLETELDDMTEFEELFQNPELRLYIINHGLRAMQAARINRFGKALKTQPAPTVPVDAITLIKMPTKRNDDKNDPIVARLIEMGVPAETINKILAGGI